MGGFIASEGCRLALCCPGVFQVAFFVRAALLQPCCNRAVATWRFQKARWGSKPLVALGCKCLPGFRKSALALLWILDVFPCV